MADKVNICDVRVGSSFASSFSLANEAPTLFPVPLSFPSASGSAPFPGFMEQVSQSIWNTKHIGFLEENSKVRSPTQTSKLSLFGSQELLAQEELPETVPFPATAYLRSHSSEVAVDSAAASVSTSISPGNFDRKALDCWAKKKLEESNGRKGASKEKGQGQPKKRKCGKVEKEGDSTKKGNKEKV